MTNEVKDYFYAELEKLGLSYTPSHSSFVFVNAGQDGAELYQRMAARNIKLSRLGMDGNPLLKNYLRFTMGTHDTRPDQRTQVFRQQLGCRHYQLLRGDCGA